MRKLIQKLLTEHGTLSCREMAQKLGTSTQHVNYYVKAMGLEVVGSEKNAKGNTRKVYGIKKKWMIANVQAKQ